MTGDVAARIQPPSSELAALSAILLDAMQLLADVGEVDAACWLAGRACVALRRGAPEFERRHNALLHRLVNRLPDSN